MRWIDSNWSDNMAVEIRVPALGESIVEATVGRWLKQTGDPVAAGEALVELETDKVNIEVTAEANGTLGAITRREGENVAIGDVLGTIEAGGASAPAPAPAAAPPPTVAPAPPPTVAPAPQLTTPPTPPEHRHATKAP